MINRSGAHCEAPLLFIAAIKATVYPARQRK
jgi:hypothetical protein